MIEIRYDSMETTSATRGKYDEIYEKEGILQRDSFYLWLIDLLGPEAGKSLLDVSCGEGRLVTLAMERGLKSFGVDFSISGLAKGAIESPSAGWLAGDGEYLPIESGSMDYVTHVGSLEHYQDLQRGAAEVSRVLKPGGKACILVPNAFGLMGNVLHVLRTGEVFDDGRQPIQRYATRGTWADLLSENGLHLDRVLGYGEVERPRTRQDTRWLIRRPRKMIKLILSCIIPTNLKNHLVFICSPQ